VTNHQSSHVWASFGFEAHRAWNEWRSLPLESSSFSWKELQYEHIV